MKKLLLALFAVVVLVGAGVAVGGPGGPSSAQPGASTKKVFAHYIPQFTISEDNQPASADYYATQYLTVSGEGGKHAAYGGFLRERPLPRAPLAGDWQLADMRTEVRRAANAGIDGFTVDILTLSGYLFDRVNLLMQAAALENPNFRIVLMPDMTTVGSDPQALADALGRLASYPSVARLSDQRLVVSPLYAELQSAAWWTNWITIMAQKYNQKIAFVPCFLNWRANAAAFAPISYGFSDWGSRSVLANADAAQNGLDAHAMGKIWMQPVSGQDARPYASVYNEADNSANLRSTWESALTSADWVQITTWNDYAEETNISPSTHVGWSLLDLCAYYIVAFKTGAAPALTRDAVYLSHRTQFAADAPTGGQTQLMTLRTGSTPAHDYVEALTLLVTPATVTVTVGGQAYSCDEPAGVSSCRVPLAPGSVQASLWRGGVDRLDLRSPYLVSHTPAVQDLEYHFVRASD